MYLTQGHKAHQLVARRCFGSSAVTYRRHRGGGQSLWFPGNGSSSFFPWYDDLMGEATTSSMPTSSNSSSWGFKPSIDVKESNEEIAIHCEVPGVSKEDLNLNLHDGFLVLSGKKEDRVEDKGTRWHRLETRRGEFYRSIAVPAGVEMSDISASYKDGVLEVKVKKPEVQEEKPKDTSIPILSRE